MTRKRVGNISIELLEVKATAHTAALLERDGNYSAASELWGKVADRHPDFREGDYARTRRDFCNNALFRQWH